MYGNDTAAAYFGEKTPLCARNVRHVIHNSVNFHAAATPVSPG